MGVVFRLVYVYILYVNLLITTVYNNIYLQLGGTDFGSKWQDSIYINISTKYRGVNVYPRSSFVVPIIIASIGGLADVL